MSQALFKVCLMSISYIPAQGQCTYMRGQAFQYSFYPFLSWCLWSCFLGGLGGVGLAILAYSAERGLVPHSLHTYDAWDAFYLITTVQGQFAKIVLITRKLAKLTSNLICEEIWSWSRSEHKSSNVAQNSFIFKSNGREGGKETMLFPIKKLKAICLTCKCILTVFCIFFPENWKMCIGEVMAIFKVLEGHYLMALYQ